MRKRIRAFSIVEIIVAFVILSLAVIYLLILTNNALREAKKLQVKRRMIAAAEKLSSQIEEVLTVRYGDVNWTNVFTSGVTLVKDNNGIWDLGQPRSGCYVQGNLLTRQCPLLTEVEITDLPTGMAYYVLVNRIEGGVFEYTVVIGCREASGCDIKRYGPVKISRVIVQ